MAPAPPRAALPACRCCGRTESRMLGLLTLWFGSLVELTDRPGYFYLCPRCYADRVQPAYAELLDRLGRAPAAESRTDAREPPPLLPNA